MTPEDLARELGGLTERFSGLNERFNEHIEKENDWQFRIEEALKGLVASVGAINGKLSEANGARKVLIWAIGIAMSVGAFISGQHWPK